MWWQYLLILLCIWTIESAGDAAKPPPIDKKLLSYLGQGSKSNVALLEKIEHKMEKSGTEPANPSVAVNQLLSLAQQDIQQKENKLKKEEKHILSEQEQAKRDAEKPSPKKVLLDMPPRYMWGWQPGSSGYCGSATVQTVAIFFGNWISQDYVRGVFGPPQGMGAREILFEESEGKGFLSVALRALGLRFEQWAPQVNLTLESPLFLQWAKKHLEKKHPVILGTWWKGPESEHRSDWAYDHIVPLIGFETQSYDKYDPTDVFFWNDLQNNMTIRSVAKDWVMEKNECTTVQHPDPPDKFCCPKVKNWGIAILGNYIMKGAAPTQIKIPYWKEPDYSVEDAENETPELWNVTVTAFQLERGRYYQFKRYNSSYALPNGTRMGTPDKVILIAPNNTQQSITDEIPSKSATHYRCILLDPKDFDQEWKKFDQKLLANGGVDLLEYTRLMREGAKMGNVTSSNGTRNGTVSVNNREASGINETASTKQQTEGNKNSDASASKADDTKDTLKDNEADDKKNASPPEEDKNKASKQQDKIKPSLPGSNNGGKKKAGSKDDDEDCSDKDDDGADDCEDNQEASKEAHDQEEDEIVDGKSASTGKAVGLSIQSNTWPLSFPITLTFLGFIIAFIWIAHRKVPVQNDVYEALLEFDEQEF